MLHQKQSRKPLPTRCFLAMLCGKKYTHLGKTMKENIHPKYEEVVVTCSCGHTFNTHSTYGRKDLHLEICSACHPFYTGQQKLVDTSGRVEKFKQKYARKTANDSSKA